MKKISFLIFLSAISLSGCVVLEERAYYHPQPQTRVYTSHPGTVIYQEYREVPRPVIIQQPVYIDRGRNEHHDHGNHYGNRERGPVSTMSPPKSSINITVQEGGRKPPTNTRGRFGDER